MPGSIEIQQTEDLEALGVQRITEQMGQEKW